MSYGAGQRLRAGALTTGGAGAFGALGAVGLILFVRLADPVGRTPLPAAPLCCGVLVLYSRQGRTPAATTSTAPW